MMEKIKEFIKSNIPPGCNYSIVLRYFIIGNLLALVYTLGFWGKYSPAYSDLFYRQPDGSRLLSGKMMIDFAELYNGFSLGFIICAVTFLTLVIHYYSYYRQNSKSIYLMKRLPKAFEMHKRALTVPFLMTLSTLVISLVITVINFSLYMIITPDECINSNQWAILWRCFYD